MEGPAFLGVPFIGLAEMARIPHRSQTRNGRPVASKRICIILDPPLKTLRSRSAGNRQKNPRVSPQNGQCQSDLVKSENPRRAAETRDQDLGTVRGPAVTQKTKPSFPDVAHFPGQSCQGLGLHRFFRGSHCQLSRPVCPRRSCP